MDTLGQSQRHQEKLRKVELARTVAEEKEKELKEVQSCTIVILQSYTARNGNFVEQSFRSSSEKSMRVFPCNETISIRKQSSPCSVCWQSVGGLRSFQVPHCHLGGTNGGYES